MGIQDRDYYRNDGPSFLGSLMERGVVCKWLIGINIACFFLQLLTRTTTEDVFGRTIRIEPFTDALILNVEDVLHGQVWRLLTYAFLHSTGSIWHILFNMLILYWFGRQVEERIGPGEFLAFYLTGAVLAGLAFVGVALTGLTPGGSCLGASGAVMAALVLAALYNPRQIIYVMFVLPVPIWGVVIFMVVADAFNLLGGTSGGVATAAHLGGAAFGFCYYRLHWRLTGWSPGGGSARSRRAEPRLRLYQEEDEESTPTPVSVAARAEEETLEAQVDAILEKISRVGKDNLTENERQILLRASEAIRRRRS
jgi:membrane associated rhomboid family serine protease